MVPALKSSAMAKEDKHIKTKCKSVLGYKDICVWREWVQMESPILMRRGKKNKTHKHTVRARMLKESWIWVTRWEQEPTIKILWDPSPQINRTRHWVTSEVGSEGHPMHSLLFGGPLMKARGSTLSGLAPVVLPPIGTQKNTCTGMGVYQLKRITYKEIWFPPPISLTDKNDFTSSFIKDMARVTSSPKLGTLKSFSTPLCSHYPYPVNC